MVGALSPRCGPIQSRALCKPGPSRLRQASNEPRTAQNADPQALPYSVRHFPLLIGHHRTGKCYKKSVNRIICWCDAPGLFNVSRGEKVFDYFQTGRNSFVKFFGDGTAALGHVGFSAALAADDRSDLSDDVTGLYSICKIVGYAYDNSDFAVVFSAKHDDTGLETREQCVRQLTACVCVKTLDGFS